MLCGLWNVTFVVQVLYFFKQSNAELVSSNRLRLVHMLTNLAQDIYIYVYVCVCVYMYVCMCLHNIGQNSTKKRWGYVHASSGIRTCSHNFWAIELVVVVVVVVVVAAAVVVHK